MEIAIRPYFQQISWKVKGFFQLPQKDGSFLDSPDFQFNGDRFCMRLYPEVKSKENFAQFHVRRLSFNFAERAVGCRIGLQMRERDGGESYDYEWSALEQNCVYLRSTIENERNVFVPGGSLTMVCLMRFRTGTADEDQEGFPEVGASFSTRWSSPKMELTTVSPCTRVCLNVFQLLELQREVDSLESPEFRFGGNTFRFRFCRNADTGDTDLQLVRLQSTFPERTVSYRVGYQTTTCDKYPRSSRSLVGTSGICISRSELEAQREKYGWDMTLRVVVLLHLGEESSRGAGISDAAAELGELTSLHKLQSDYGQLLQKGTESDACVVVRGREFRVHRNVLRARSTVFEAMFRHETAEKESGRVVIDDFDPDSFGQFLEYLYTGHVRAGLWDDNVFGLYEAADKYDVSTLKSECVDYMRGNLSLDCFCDVMTLALRHRDEDLLTVANRFFKDNIPDIITTAKWQQFTIDNSENVNEFLSKTFEPGSTRFSESGN